MQESSGRKFTIAILMATYNGQQFLKSQIESFKTQSHNDIDILASDDGSKDGTLELLKKSKATWSRGKFDIIAGPSQGFAQNFRHLILSYDGEAEYLAFSDQDDIWLPEKLSTAVAWLQRAGSQPAAYGARTMLIDEAGNRTGISRLFKKEPSFRNALVQSIAGGNTIVMNRAAFSLIQESARRTNFVSHDWWTYQIVTGSGGIFYYDPTPSTLYRQHGQNLVGENRSLVSLLNRLRSLFGGRFEQWIADNIVSIGICRDLLSDQNQKIFEQFSNIETGTAAARVRALIRSGVRRQTMAENIILFLRLAFYRGSKI